MHTDALAFPRTPEDGQSESCGLIGRERELDELVALASRERLITLTGAPGIGKSRLALELMSRLADGHAGGAYAVKLAPLARPAELPHALASALSLEEVAGRSLTATLIARLARQETLLVIDNCEHVLSACVQLVAALLEGCPKLRVLATSREPLGLAGERLWRVPPLAVPPAAAEAEPAMLVRYPAVALFTERARAVRPGFALTPYVATAVAEICHRLDGIPLALELAAARVESLTPDEIATRLADRFGLLRRGAGGEPSHHQTLAAALDWSHALLSGSERALLRRLSVFAGGFCPAAVAAVCAGGEVEPGSVGELLGRLEACSLVGADADAGEPARWCLLETLRAYAAERLDEAGERASLRDSHTRFYLALAERAEPDLTGPRQQRWLARLEAEHANLRAAIEWALAHNEVEAALRLSGALVLFWRMRCRFSEGRELLEAAVAVGDGSAITADRAAALRAKALWGVGFMAHMTGDSDGALPALQESLARWQELGDDQGRARALLVLGNCRSFRADPAALSLLGESAVAAREADDPWCLGHALALAGFEHVTFSRLPAARPLFEECLEVARAAGEKQALRFGLIGLGSVCVMQGDYHLAQSLLDEALAVTEELGEDYGKAAALCRLGELALGRGDYGRAGELLDRSITLFSDIGSPTNVIEPLALRARVAQSEGDIPRARGLYEDALARNGDSVFIGALQGLGDIAIAEGDSGSGRRLLERARERAWCIGHKRSLAQALHALGRLAREDGNAGRSTALHNEALELQREIGDEPGTVASLEALAGLAAVAGRHRHAAHLMGASKALRGARGYARAPAETEGCEADHALLRSELSVEELDAAFDEGAKMSIDEAVAHALKGRRRRGRPAGGWQTLTNREQEVAALVVEGLTNREIAERLFVAPGTVKNHLSHIFSRLGVAGRVELQREARRSLGQSSASETGPPPEEHRWGAVSPGHRRRQQKDGNSESS